MGERYWEKLVQGRFLGEINFGTKPIDPHEYLARYRNVVHWWKKEQKQIQRRFHSKTGKPLKESTIRYYRASCEESRKHIQVEKKVIKLLIMHGYLTTGKYSNVTSLIRYRKETAKARKENRIIAKREELKYLIEARRGIHEWMRENRPANKKDRHRWLRNLKTDLRYYKDRIEEVQEELAQTKSAQIISLQGYLEAKAKLSKAGK